MARFDKRSGRFVGYHGSDVRAPCSAHPVEDLAAQELLLDLSVSYPVPEVCVVRVGGELDMFTAPLFSKHLSEALSATPPHLVIDLAAVQFLSSGGLDALVMAREVALSTGVVLHLAGMEQRLVARPLEVTGLRLLFATHPTLGHALSTLTS